MVSGEIGIQKKNTNSEHITFFPLPARLRDGGGGGDDGSGAIREGP